MKSFHDYNDGDWVVYKNPGHSWHLMNFQAYKSKWTNNAFRLKYGDREVVADISEIEPISEATKLAGENDKLNRNNQRNFTSPEVDNRPSYDDNYDDGAC